MRFDFWEGVRLLSVLGSVLATGQEKTSVPLKPVNFSPTIQKGFWLIKFYAPGCGSCESLAPIWSELISDYSSWGAKNDFNFGELNCIENRLFCSELGFEEFPTIALFKDGNRQSGECSFADSKKDLEECLEIYVKHYDLFPFNETKKEEAPETDGEVVAEVPGDKDALKLDPTVTENVDGKIKVLTVDTFEKETETGPWFVKFFAPWCGHCQKLAPTWEKLANDMKGVVNIGQVDCTTDKAICESMGVRGYPTLKIMKNGKSKEYKGARELEALSRTLLKKFGERPTLSPQEAIEKIKQEEVALIAYDSSTEALPEPVVHALSDVEVDLAAYRAKGYWPDRAAYNIQKTPSLLMLKDGKVTEFMGSLSNQTEMLEWILQEQHPIVRSINPDALRDMFELNEGLVVLKAGHGLTRAEDAKSFRDFAEPILRRASSPLYFGIIDVDNSEIRQWFMLSKNIETKLIFLELKTKKFYSTNVYGTPIGFDYKEICDAIDAQLAGKLTGFELKFNSNASFMTFSLSVILPLLVIFGVVCYIILSSESQDEEKKAN